MKGKQIILTVLCCFVLFSAVNTDEVIEPSQRMDFASTLAVAQAAYKVDYEEKVFVEVDATHYYRAKIYNRNDKIQISILNEEVQRFELLFKRLNPVVFIDAYQNIIIVKEVTPLGHILSYFVLLIIYDATAGEFTLDYFAVNPRVNHQFFHMNMNFEIKQIIELDINREWIAVTDDDGKCLDVYKINIHEKLNILITVGWLELKGARITGGNSMVLYDQANNQFWVDVDKNKRPGVPTVYDKISICKLTNLPLYGDCSRTVELAGWNFQYVSQSQNHKSLTTFTYQGYGDLPIKGQAHLKSDKAIKYFKDDYSFFLAITDCDIYLANVQWDAVTKSYDYFGNTLSNTISNSGKREDIYKDWRKIVVIVFIDGKFYFLSGNKFYVYDTCPYYFNKVYEKDCIYNDDGRWVTLFVEINKYMNKSK